MIGNKIKVARLNLPNMAYPPEDRLEMYLAAQTGLARLETSPETVKKGSHLFMYVTENQGTRY